MYYDMCIHVYIYICLDSSAQRSLASREASYQKPHEAVVSLRAGSIPHGSLRALRV